MTVSGSGATYTITLARPITQPERVTVTIANPAFAPFERRLDVPPGDLNDDGKVNTQDLLRVRADWLGINQAKPTIFGDINGDGVVNQRDDLDVLAAIGMRLPAVGGAAAAAPPASSGEVGGSPAVAIGTTPRSDPGPTTTDRLTSAIWSRPRAEVRLAVRGRGRSPAASSRPRRLTDGYTGPVSTFQ